MDRVERAKNTELKILLLCPLGSRTYVLQGHPTRNVIFECDFSGTYNRFQN